MNKIELVRQRAITWSAWVLALISLALVLACENPMPLTLPTVPPPTSTAELAPTFGPTLLPSGVATFNDSLAVLPPVASTHPPPTAVSLATSRPTLLPGGVATISGPLSALPPLAPTQPPTAPGPTQGTDPVPTLAGSTDPSIDDLIISPMPDVVPDYSRRDWRHWVDADDDCQDTRQEVLVEQSVGIIIFTDVGQCRVATGQWVAPFTGTVVTDPSKLDIDHLVPLANAHRSGGHAWDTNRRRVYANDLNNPAHLVAVTVSANRAKGARGPEDWRPPDEAYWCQYGGTGWR